MEHLPRERWYVVIPDAHEGYVSWRQYERNLKQLQENARGQDSHRKYPVREGPALLQGLALCGICGARMSVRYYVAKGRVNPYYLCNGAGNTHSLPKCQAIPGGSIDDAISELLLEAVTPLALEVALSAQKEIEARIDEADQLRRKQVERARYESELARRRFMRVDPDNRLVADELEAEWNSRLREVRASQEEYERRREADRLVLSDQMKERIDALACDFPKLWRDPKTPERERKRMARLLIEDVTLTKRDDLTVGVRFRGGATRTLTLPRPRPSWEEWKTPADVLALIDRLLDDHTSEEIAGILNERGFVSGGEKRFDGDRVAGIVRRYRLKSRRARLRERGLLTLCEVARKLGFCKATVKLKRAAGQLGIVCYQLDDMGQYMYEDPEARMDEKPSILTARPQEV